MHLFYVSIFPIAVLFLARHVATAKPSSPTQYSCDQLVQLAKDYTGDGRHQTCHTAGPDPPECSRMECSGEERFTMSILPGGLNFKYCFGFQLNGCTDPGSMDFYIKLPTFHFSRSLRVTQDTTFLLKGIHLPWVSSGLTSELDVVFERQTQNNVLVSVTSKVKLAGTYVSQLERDIIERQVLHMPPCPPGKAKDENSTPPDDFMPLKCPEKNYTSPATEAPATEAPASSTLNKVCDLTGRLCSEGELCDLSASPAKCVCNPDLKEEGSACVKKSRRGQSCTSRGDCGINELCQGNPLTCHCVHGNSFDSLRDMCVRPPPGHQDDTVPPAPATPSAPRNSSSDHHTAAPNKPSGSGSGDTDINHASKKDKKTNWPLIVGASVGGCIVMAGALLGSVLLIRRCRNRTSQANSGFLSDSNAPLLGGDDDEANLIM